MTQPSSKTAASSAKTSSGRYTEEFKAQVVAAVHAGASAFSAAKRFGLSSSAVLYWLKKSQVAESPEPRSVVSSSSDDELSRLAGSLKKAMLREILLKAADHFTREAEALK